MAIDRNEMIRTEGGEWVSLRGVRSVRVSGTGPYRVWLRYADGDGREEVGAYADRPAAAAACEAVARLCCGLPAAPPFPAGGAST